MMLPPTFDSKGGNGVFVPKRRTCFAAGACPNTSHPAPRPAANVTMATITARTAETPRAPRTAYVGGAPPPAAMGRCKCVSLFECHREENGWNGTRTPRDAKALTLRPA